MANFTISQLEELVAIEQGSRDNTGQPLNGVNTGYHPPPNERSIRRQIYDVLYKAADWRSRADIAAALQKGKTDWLINHIEQLVTQGYVVKEKTTLANGMSQFWYAVPR